MNEKWLEIKRFDGNGFQPLLHFGTWRVAILRWEQSMLPEKITFMERHTQTDEVFVLLRGEATLILGGNFDKVSSIHSQPLETGTLYNVRQNVWHTVVLSRDASILIVEESNTGEKNTEYYRLTPELQGKIIHLAD